MIGLIWMKNKKWNILLTEWGFMVLTWLFIFYFYYLVVYWGTGQFFQDSFLKNYVFSYKAHIEIVLASVFFGLLFGIIDTISDHATIRKMPFTWIILIKSFLYALASLIVIGIVLFIFTVFKIFPQDVIGELKDFYTIPILLSFILYLSFFIILVNVGLQLNRKFGPGELGKIVSGKYHTPREENRIFLFLDMKGSTAIAEKLGNLSYSKFIRQCFIDLSDIIIKYEATIYQHVGDEIVLSWENENALHQLNPIYLFFEFQEKLKNRTRYYQNKFGLLPEFKAAIHMGLVVVAETSDLKREIAFHGDVMNTTARLEKQCNKYEEKLLISESVKNTITHLNGYTFKYLGEILLKGKKSFLKIYSVNKMI